MATAQLQVPPGVLKQLRRAHTFRHTVIPREALEEERGGG